MVFCDSIKNTALTHLPEESFHESIKGWQVLEIPGKGKKLLLTHSSQSLPQLLLPSKGCIFLPMLTLQNTVNLKNKKVQTSWDFKFCD